MRVFWAPVKEHLCQCYCDVVLFATDETKAFRGRIDEWNVVINVVLEVHHPRTSEVRGLAKEISLASQAVSSLAQARHVATI